MVSFRVILIFTFVAAGLISPSLSGMTSWFSRNKEQPTDLKDLKVTMKKFINKLSLFGTIFSSIQQDEDEFDKLNHHAKNAFKGKVLRIHTKNVANSKSFMDDYENFVTLSVDIIQKYINIVKNLENEINITEKRNEEFKDSCKELIQNLKLKGVKTAITDKKAEDLEKRLEKKINEFQEQVDNRFNRISNGEEKANKQLKTTSALTVSGSTSNAESQSAKEGSSPSSESRSKNSNSSSEESQQQETTAPSQSRPGSGRIDHAQIAELEVQHTTRQKGDTETANESNSVINPESNPIVPEPLFTSNNMGKESEKSVAEQEHASDSSKDKNKETETTSFPGFPAPPPTTEKKSNGSNSSSSSESAADNSEVQDTEFMEAENKNPETNHEKDQNLAPPLQEEPKTRPDSKDYSDGQGGNHGRDISTDSPPPVPNANDLKKDHSEEKNISADSVSQASEPPKSADSSSSSSAASSAESPELSETVISEAIPPISENSEKIGENKPPPPIHIFPTSKSSEKVETKNSSSSEQNNESANKKHPENEIPVVLPIPPKDFEKSAQNNPSSPDLDEESTKKRQEENIIPAAVLSMPKDVEENSRNNSSSLEHSDESTKKGQEEINIPVVVKHEPNSKDVSKKEDHREIPIADEKKKEKNPNPADSSSSSLSSSSSESQQNDEEGNNSKKVTPISDFEKKSKNSDSRNLSQKENGDHIKTLVYEDVNKPSSDVLKQNNSQPDKSESGHHEGLANLFKEKDKSESSDSGDSSQFHAPALQFAGGSLTVNPENPVPHESDVKRNNEGSGFESADGGNGKAQRNEENKENSHIVPVIIGSNGKDTSKNSKSSSSGENESKKHQKSKERETQNREIPPQTGSDNSSNKVAEDLKDSSGSKNSSPKIPSSPRKTSEGFNALEHSSLDDTLKKGGGVVTVEIKKPNAETNSKGGKNNKVEQAVTEESISVSDSAVASASASSSSSSSSESRSKNHDSHKENSNPKKVNDSNSGTGSKKNKPKASTKRTSVKKLESDENPKHDSNEKEKTPPDELEKPPGYAAILGGYAYAAYNKLPTVSGTISTVSSTVSTVASVPRAAISWWWGPPKPTEPATPQTDQKQDPTNLPK